ncbi:MAG: TrkH family potassium uptake protein [Candidatus Thermoplasmatota archaeon]|nr:TrkH family potassium uptake protein [Candidatus Thermoplasmatota archaeon]MDD5778178.1 TrkH family potassium uptake protein [Candidatus Thermoplasmatota archaeon]
MKDAAIIVRDTGAILLVVGVVTMFALLPPLLYGEQEHAVWILATAALFFLVGGLLRLLGRGDGDPRIKHAMVIAALSWLLISLISALPFIYVEDMDFLSAFFESVAGWTGTGLTMIGDESALTYTIQFWRTFTQWIGGVGVIVLTLIILARPGTGSFTLYRSEARDEKIHPSIISTVKSIWWIFLLYTGVAILVLFVAGMPAWEAVNHAMTGLATGGFSVRDDSIASYSTVVHILLIPIMMAGAISFAAHYGILNGRVKKFFTDVQTLALIALVAAGAVALALLNLDAYASFAQSFKYSAFQFVSALTCTGFQTVDLAVWGAPSKMLLSLAMIIGGAAGSTAGGIKLFRAVLLGKGVGWKIKKIFLPPNSAFSHKLGGKVIAPHEAMEEVNEAAIMSFLWLILLFVGIMVLLLTTTGTLDDVIFEVCSAQGNVGLSTGLTAAGMDPLAKAMLIINMWIGRLEIIPILVLVRSLIAGQSIF